MSQTTNKATLVKTAISLLSLVSTAFLSCPSALARGGGGYKVNPHAPNGYNASMAGYHYHGTHAPTGEKNGYAASSFRSKRGMEPLLVPDGGGGGGGRGGFADRSNFGNRSNFGERNSFSNRSNFAGQTEGGFSSRFASNQTNSEEYWSNHFKSRCQPQMSQVTSRMNQLQASTEGALPPGSLRRNNITFASRSTALRSLVNR